MDPPPRPASAAEHAVAVHQDRQVEMRDGVRLATDVYRPADATDGEPITTPAPALLVRTPYDKRDRDRVEGWGTYFARRGYVVAIQDVRGRYESEGEFFHLINEPEDGYDSVAWLAEQPYCDGQVGTMGTSYMAWVQRALATLDPPGLAAMFVNQGAANGWEATLRHNGAFELRWFTWALTVGGGFSHRALADPNVQRALANVDAGELFERGPIRPGDSPLRHVPNYERWLFAFMTAAGTDALWDERGVNFSRYVEEAADVPTVFAGGWYDSYGKATSDSFRRTAARKETDHYLIMGPWTHGGTGSWDDPVSGEVWLGQAAAIDFRATILAFFDRYLKGLDTWDRPPVSYFRMGADRNGGTHDHDGALALPGRWASADDWPLPDADPVSYYVHPDGSLAPAPPTADDAATAYRYDPNDPVPTIGGNCSSYVTFEPRSESIEDYPLADRRVESVTGRGGFDQRTRPETVGADPPYGPLAERADVVTFRTPPLEQPLEIAGPISVRVYGSTDAPDTDFTAKLVQELPPSPAYPDGFALNLADSICRARYRGYRREPDPIEPHTVYAFDMEPYPTATRLAPGDRLRLDLSSSNYPRFDVNPNTGTTDDREHRIATNAIHHDRDHPTHVTVPVRNV